MITDVLCKPAGETEFHFTVSDERQREALIGTLTLSEAADIANSKDSSEVSLMCREITKAREHQVLVGQTFGEKA